MNNKFSSNTFFILDIFFICRFVNFSIIFTNWLSAYTMKAFTLWQSLLYGTTSEPYHRDCHNSYHIITYILYIYSICSIYSQELKNAQTSTKFERVNNSSELSLTLSPNVLTGTRRNSALCYTLDNSTDEECYYSCLCDLTIRIISP